MFHFTLIQKGVSWGLLILISLLPPLQFSCTLHFFAFFLGLLLKNWLSSVVVLGLVSSLHFCILHTQILVFFALSFLIYAIISLSTECNRLGFYIALLIVKKKNGLHIVGCCPCWSPLLGILHFLLAPTTSCEDTKILQNPLSSTDYLNLLLDV